MIYSGDLIRLYGVDTGTKGFLKGAKDIKLTSVLDGVDELTFSLSGVHEIEPEQLIIFNNKRFLITEVSKIRGESGGTITEVVAAGYFVKLADNEVQKIEFISKTIEEGLSLILKGTEWTVGTIPEDAYTHSMSEEKQTVLWLLRQFAKITGYEIEFDSMQRTVNLVNQIGENTNFVFRYKKNMKGIKKVSAAPLATVIYPSGKGGLTIDTVNADKVFIENYDWYTSQGVSLATARQKFEREYSWTDESFLTPESLKRAAEKKLAELSKPQISYETNVTDIQGNKLKVGDYCSVMDEELGIQLSIRVIRLEQYPGQMYKNTIELNYAVDPTETQSSDSSSDSNQEKLSVVNNDSQLIVDTKLTKILTLSLSSYNSTNMTVGFHLVGLLSVSSLVEVIFMMNNTTINPLVKVNASGYITLGVPFTIQQVQSGSYDLEVYARVSAGTLTIDTQQTSIFVKAANMFGGASSTLPKANISQDVEFAEPDVKVMSTLKGVIVGDIKLNGVLVERPTFEDSGTKASELIDIQFL